MTPFATDSTFPANAAQNATEMPSPNPALDDVEPGSDADESPADEPMTDDDVPETEEDEALQEDDEEIGS